MTHPHALGATLIIGADRMLYAGPLRRSLAPRRLGALSIYAAPGPFDIAIGNGPSRRRTVAVVPPHMGHWITPPHGPIWNLLIEPESTTEEAMATLCADPPAGLPERFGALTGVAGYSKTWLDLLAFGAALPQRDLDPRIRAVVAALRTDPTLTAAGCALGAGLSASRLLRLFRHETGVTFRAFRMWTRARRFLDQAAGPASLTAVALGLGYPDSSHFSNSIRRIFGMGPSVLRAGTRGMQVRLFEGYSLFTV
ncbi:MAG: helix-turn-helix transcriptional regulator [Rhodobacter sp.]|nr:helix-turn-helix transcriptional regulator [Rhodobacter sp.]